MKLTRRAAHLVREGEAWFQIGGDMSPATHGAIIARYDGDAIEVREIEPVISSVGEREGAEVGFPFWTREAWYVLGDLDPDNEDIEDALRSCDFDPDNYDNPEDMRLGISEALLQYGYKVEPGPSGWAQDVTPDKVYWWANKRARGWRFLAEEDVEYRRLLRERAA
jgi:hypothetical protein